MGQHDLDVRRVVPRLVTISLVFLLMVSAGFRAVVESVPRGEGLGEVWSGLVALIPAAVTTAFAGRYLLRRKGWLSTAIAAVAALVLSPVGLTLAYILWYAALPATGFAVGMYAGDVLHSLRRCVVEQSVFSSTSPQPTQSNQNLTDQLSRIHSATTGGFLGLAGGVAVIFEILSAGEGVGPLIWWSACALIAWGQALSVCLVFNKMNNGKSSVSDHMNESM